MINIYNRQKQKQTKKKINKKQNRIKQIHLHDHPVNQ